VYSKEEDGGLVCGLSVSLHYKRISLNLEYSRQGRKPVSSLTQNEATNSLPSI